MSIIIVLKCFAYVLLFDFVDFQILENELVTSKVRFPPAPPRFYYKNKEILRIYN